MGLAARVGLASTVTWNVSVSRSPAARFASWAVTVTGCAPLVAVVGVPHISLGSVPVAQCAAHRALRVRRATATSIATGASRRPAFERIDREAARPDPFDPPPTRDHAMAILEPIEAGTDEAPASSAAPLPESPASLPSPAGPPLSELEFTGCKAVRMTSQVSFDESMSCQRISGMLGPELGRTRRVERSAFRP